MKADASSPDAGIHRGSLELDVKDLPLVQNYQTRAFLTMNVKAAGTAQDNHLRVPELRISKGLLRIPQRLQKAVQPLDPHPDVTFAGEEKKPEPVAESSKSPWKATVKVVIPEDFHVEAPLGSNLTLGANLDVRIDEDLARDGGPPVDVVGDVRIVRGVIDLIRRFEVEKGIVTFYPRNFQDPTLEIRARHEGPGATVFVDMGGTASMPTKNFTSRPAMLEQEILYFLATGQMQNRAQSEAVSLDNRFQDAGLSLLGSAAAGLVKEGVQRLVGADIDVLSFEADTARGLGRIRAGKFVTERFYVGTQYNPAANVQLNEDTVQIEGEYRLGSTTYFRGRGGNTNRYNVEFLWEKNLTTKSQQNVGAR